MPLPEEERLERDSASKRRYAAKRYAADPVTGRSTVAEWRKANPDRDRETQRLARLKRKEKSRAYQNMRVETDPQYRIARLIRCRFSKAVRRVGKTCSAIESLGCTVAELITHLERQFARGMSWDNYGEWHIDHVRPLAGFDLTDESQVAQACHFTNLRPLWGKENQSKGAKTLTLL